MSSEEEHKNAAESPGRIFLRLYRDFQQRCDPKLESFGYSDVTEAHLNVLANVDPKGTRSVVLAERVSMSKQAMGDLLQELIRRNYLSREPDAADRRAAVIRLTDRGTRFLIDAEKIKEQMVSEYETILGKQGAESFFASAFKILNSRRT